MKRFGTRPLLGALTGILFLAHALFYWRALGGDAIDDAYISFVYARNAILGYGLVFNPGERVEGFTNFLWTGMMIPVVGAGLDVGRVSIVLGALLALATLWLTVRLARAARLPSWTGRLAALCLAADGSFAIWAVSGLETAMFAFLVTLGALLYLVEQTRSRWISNSGIVFALAAMTRPEAAAVFALTAGHQLAWRVLKERRLFAWTDITRGLTFSALFVPYWLLRWRYYHSFFPNSFYAKVAPGGPIAQIERGWHYVTQFVDVHLGILILLPAVIALLMAFARSLRRNPDEREAERPLFAQSYFALAVLAYAAYITYVGGDWSVGRFFVPVLPLAYLLLAAGLVEIYRFLKGTAERLLSSGRLRGPAPLAAGAAALMLFLGALAFDSSWNGEYGIFVRGFDAARATEARETMGRWLRAHVPAGTLIAVDAAGQVPFYSGLPAIDMFGINDLHIGRLSVPTLGEGTPGHEKFDLAYVIQRDPQYVVIYGTLLDNVTQYRRAPVQWTTDRQLMEFLTLYERK